MEANSSTSTASLEFKVHGVVITDSSGLERTIGTSNNQLQGSEPKV